VPPHILPSPPPFGAPGWAIWVFFFVAGAAAVLAALPWSLYAGFAKRNWLPLIVIVSGFLCSLSEPMLDLLGHLRWANNLPTAFTNFGIDVPWLIPPCYAAFLGLESYFCYYMLRRGITVNQCVMVWAVGGVTDAIMETVGLNLHIYEYYGLQPYTLFRFPYWWGFINGASFFTIGFMLWFLVPRLQGARKLWLLAVSPAGMMMTYFTTGWVHILAQNAELPVWTRWVATTVTMALCVGLVRFLGSFAAVAEPTHRWHFGHFFIYRLLTRSARERLDAKVAVRPEPARESAAVHS
jgi:hypothetical protein